MSNNVVEFPGREPSPEGYSAEHVDKVHAEAFRDLEGHIHDCVQMSEIAAQKMGNTTCNDEGLVFAVFHLHEMLLKLEKYYRAGWHGEVPISSLIKGSTSCSRDIKE